MTHTLDFTDLQKGQAFARLPLAITSDEVEAYLESTGESSETWRELVPPIFLDTVAIAGAPSALPKSNGTMPMTGTSVGTAVWIDATAASMDALEPSVATEPGVSVCVSSLPPMITRNFPLKI